jgi:hypothetical protein
LPLFQCFGINKDNLGYFVLNNTQNNDIILQELGRQIDFDPIQKRLCYMGHILNLITEAYLFGQDESSWKEDFKEAGIEERRKLWRQ